MTQTGLRRLSGNAIASVTVTIVSAVLLFELYRFLVRAIGIEQIGVWSLLIATAGGVRLADLGVSGSVVRFMAVDMGAGRPGAAAATLTQTILFSAGTIGLASLLAVAPVGWVISRAVDHDEVLALALQVLPWVMAAAWLSALVTALAAALDAVQQTVLRALAMICGSALQLALVYLYVPTYGLLALGPIQVTFTAAQLLILSVALAWTFRSHWRNSLRWSYARLVEMVRYGFVIQMAGLGQLLFEPVIRWLLGNFSGLATIGYYDMANRAVVQFRQVIVSAYQMLVPFMANRSTRLQSGTEQIAADYRVAFRLLLLVTVPYFALVGSALPFILVFWSGKFDDVFLLIGLISTLGWSVSTLNIPAYMFFLAIGKVRWIAVSQLLLGVLNVVFGYLGGTLYGGIGVVVGAMLALALSSLAIVWRFHFRYRIRLYREIPKVFWPMLLIGAGALSVFYREAIHWAGQGIPDLIWFVALAAVAALLAALVWHDPLRVQVTKQLLRH